MTLPKKLRKDCILEVTCEVRFDSVELPEIVLGKLASISSLVGHQSTRTGFADIPAPIRKQDPNLKYQSLIDFVNPATNAVFKVGTNSLAYVSMGNYRGWDVIYTEIMSYFKESLDILGGANITRIGLRYVNAMNAKDHLTNKINDLDLGVFVAGAQLEGKFNLNYEKDLSEQCMVTVRISTPEFVFGLPSDAIALVDLDVFSKEPCTSQDSASIQTWINMAHDLEKKEFFSLIPNEILTQIRED